MEQRTKRDLTLMNLVSDFEAKYESGKVDYLQEKTLFQLISYYEEERQLEKALDVVEIALEQFKYRSDFYILKARILLYQDDIEQCIEVLDQAAPIAPFENELSIIRAKALGAKGEFDEALILLDELKSSTMTSELSEVLICESYIYQLMKDHEMMYEVLKQSLHLNPKNEEALERMLQCTELSRKYEEGIEFFKELLDIEPYSYLAWYNLGHAYNYIGEYQKAIEAIEYSFIINPSFENGYLDCADICFQEGEFQRAYNIYAEANENFGPESDLIVSMATCQYKMKNITKAKHLLYKAIKLDPYNDEAYFTLGECYVQDNNWYSAINAYHKALDIDDASEEYYYHLAKAYVEVEDYTKATFNFNKAIKKGPIVSAFYADYASFLIKLGLYHEALCILDESEEYTYGADLLFCRAIALIHTGRREEGISFLEEAFEEDFNMHKIIFTISPEMEVDKEITSMIKYYKAEQNQA